MMGSQGRRRVSTTIGAVLALYGGGFLTSNTVDAQSIQWRSEMGQEIVAPVAEPMTPADVAVAMHELVGDGTTQRVILQFSGPMSPADREHLDRAGVTVLSPLGSHAFFATLHGERLNVPAVAAVNALQRLEPIAREHKLHPQLDAGVAPAWTVVDGGVGDGEGEPADPIVAVNVLFHRDVTPTTRRAVAEAFNATIRAELKTVPALVLELSFSQVGPLADRDEVQWIEPPLPPLDELNAENREMIQANEVQAAPYGLDGTGVSVMVYDGGAAFADHADFGGRLSVRDNSNLSDHATHVAGTIGGDGAQSGGDLRGMAPNTTLESYGFQWGSGGVFLYSNPGDIEQDYGDAINGLGAVIANNSIGTNTATNGFPCDITGDYGITSSVIDAVVRGDLGAPIRIVWANGNERQSSRCGDEYFTTAPPACAKNHLTVGALNSNDASVTDFTSWGPADDGRLKPDLSAPGCEVGGGVVSTSTSGGYSSKCGTSMASPTVAGAAALLLQDFRQQFPGQPDFLPSTMKALFIHNTQDLLNPGPDYQTGYGLIQIQDTIDFMRTGNFQEAQVGHGETNSFVINVAGPTDALKATLVWDDLPGTPNVVPSLINDLDLRVIGPDGTFHPWTLDPQNPAAPAGQSGPDRLNNIEQIIVENPTPGLWTLEVIGFNVPEGPQTFSVTAGPTLVNTAITFPGGLPALIAPGEETTLQVRVVSTGESTVADSVSLRYRANDGAFDTIPLTSLGGDLYEATLPGADCAAAVEYYFVAEGSISGEVTSPGNAPANVYTAEIGVEVELFADQFDTDQGWLVGAPGDDATSGIWERVAPVGTETNGVPVQPDAALFGDECFVTGQHPGGGAGENDVDFGTTTLRSPTIDLTSVDRAVISYWRWYSNSAGAEPNTDVFEIDISADGGQSWTDVEVIGPAGPGTAGGWFEHEFAVEDLVPLTSQIQLRFIATDDDPQSLVEAAVDGILVRGFFCEDVEEPCPADLTGDGAVNVLDLLQVLGSWGACDAPCASDLNDDGTVDVLDLLDVLGAWGACP